MQSGKPQIAFPIDAMLDQSIDQSAGATPGMLSELVNLRKELSGRLVKRAGYPYVGQITASVPVRAMTHGDSVAMATKAAMLHAYGEGTDRLTTVDRAPQWVLTGAQVVAQPPYFLSYSGCCSASGATFHIYVDQNVGVTAVKCVVIDEVSGDVVRQPEVVIAANAGAGETGIPLARIVTNGTTIWLVYQVTKATPELRCKAVAVSTILTGGSWPAHTSLGTLDAVNPSFDLTVGSTVAYTALNYDNSGTKQLRVHRIDNTGTVTHTYSINVACRAVSCLLAGSIVWAHYALVGSPANTDLRALTDNNLTFLATTGGPGSASGDVETTCLGFFDSDSVIAVAAGDSNTAHNPRGHFNFFRADYSGGAITPTGTMTSYGCYPASQPFRTGVGGDGSDVFMWVECATDTVDPFGSVALIALTHDGGALYSTATSSAVGQFPHLRVQAGRVQWPYMYGAVLSTYVVPQKVYGSSQDANSYVWDGNFRIPPDTNSAVREYRFQLARPYINAALAPTESHGLTLATGGAQCFAYDGRLFTELGFCSRPASAIDYVTTSGAGGNIGAGNYQWAVTYEFLDSAGNRHQSAPWFSGVKTTTGSTSKATLVVPTLKMTTKQDREHTDQLVRIVVWRTLSTDAGTFYRVIAVVNNPEVATVTITDPTADVGIATNEILYTIRGELANECPPPMRHAVQFAGKIAFIDAEYPTRVGFSKPLQSGRGPEFSSASETFVEGIGDLTALAEMDGNLYAFSASGVAWVASGSGIDATGNGSWPEPQILSRAAGCIDPRALCVTQDGVVFASRQGDAVLQFNVPLRVWLLPRGGGNLVDIGAKARLYLMGFSVLGSFAGVALRVTSCVNWVDGGRVIITFSCSDANDKSYWIEYDYVNRGQDGLGSWCAGNTGGAAPIASAVAARGRHWFAVDAGAQGALVRSSDTSALDHDGYAPYIIRTHDIKATAIPRSKLNQITVTLTTYGANAAGVKFELSDNGFTSVVANHTFAFASVAALATVQRQWQPDVRRNSTGMGYALQISSLDPGGESGNPDTFDVVPTAVSIDLIPLRGTYAPASGERA